MDCSLHYCVGCHRNTHANPFGVRQKAKATQKEYSDHGAMLWMLTINNTSTIHTYIHKFTSTICIAHVEFLLRLHNCGHKWTPTKLLQCQLCFSKTILAGIRCNQCAKDLCRPCSRRYVTLLTTKLNAVSFLRLLYLIIFFSVLHFFNVLVAGLKMIFIF